MTRRGRATLGYRLLALVVLVFERLLGWRVEAHGLEHLPRTGGAVLTWAHTSHVDFVVTALVVWRETGRPCRLLAMRELWGSPLFGWVPRAAGAVPVDRGSARGRVMALRAAEQAVTDGDLVLLAPEGTIATSFEVLPLRAGAARIAQRAGVPLVPSASWGSHRFSTTGHGPHWWRARRVPVVVAFGAPVDTRGSQVEVTAALEAASRDLLHGLQETYPDGAPQGAWWVPARLGGGAPRHEDVLAVHRPGSPLTAGGLRARPRGRGRDR